MPKFSVDLVKLGRDLTKRPGNPPKVFQGNLGEGEILFHLARSILNSTFSKKNITFSHHISSPTQKLTVNCWLNFFLVTETAFEAERFEKNFQ